MDGRLRRLETALGRGALRAELEAAAVEAAALAGHGLTADDILDELRAMAAATVGLSPAEVEAHVVAGVASEGGTADERAALAAWLSGNAGAVAAALGTGGRA